MKNTILKYGLMAATILIVLPLLSTLFLEKGPEDYTLGEIVGYSTMVLSLLLILVAQNEFRKQSGNQIKYTQGLIIGLAISALAGTAFGIYNWIYVEFINPEFMEQYYGYYIDSIKSSNASADEIAATIAQLNSEKEMWMNPFVQFFGMFITVFGVGLIVSLISAGFMSKLTPANHG